MNTQSLPRIVRIIAVEPFQVTALWTTAEVRRIDFQPLFEEWKSQGNTLLYPLFNFDNLKEVIVSTGSTLQWPSVPIRLELADRTIEGHLDLDPDELYRQSEVVRRDKTA